MNIEDISFDAQTYIALFRAKTYTVEDTMEINRKIQVPALPALNTGTGPKLNSKSIVPPSWQNRIYRLNVPRLLTSSKKPLPIKGFMLVHVCIGDLEVLVWFCAVKELSINILVGRFFINCYVRDISLSSRKITIRN